MLLEALVACAGVTLNAVATALGIELRDASLQAEGDLDFRGTLGVAKDAPVGFKNIRLQFTLDTDASEEQLATLMRLTERYCVVYQTLANPPALAVTRKRATAAKLRLSSIQPCSLPGDALLNAYRTSGAFTDCYATDIDASVSHRQFVAAFYTTPLFKLERVILKWAVSKPSSDDDAQQLAAGEVDTFAAWRVEKRSENQLLLCDLHGRTRSWLMVAPLKKDRGPATRLYFGSAVVPERSGTTEEPTLGFGFRALLGFHQMYSKALLSAAKSRLNGIERR